MRNELMLCDQLGNRKYLTKAERQAFIDAARRAAPEIETFCLALACAGARISEVLALVPRRFGLSSDAVIIESLKKRKRGVYRAIPVPDYFLHRIDTVHGIFHDHCDATLAQMPVWCWSRTTAWNRVKTIMRAAGITEELAMPKALRHAFGVGGTQAGVPLNLIQRCLGHADIQITAIYTNVMGDEERVLADRMWS